VTKASNDDLELRVDERRVSARLDRPTSAKACLVLAHGAGAGMHHAFMRDVVDALGRARIATLRYQFPYMESGARRPDPPRLLHATVRAAIRRAAELATDLPLFAGGKSMGGRMTSQAASEEELAGVSGLVFFGFPLHPPKTPSVARAEHLSRVTLPMLFLQGTRDALADLALVRGVVGDLPRATLHVVEGADHGFDVLVRSGRTRAEVLDELASTTADWMDELVARPSRARRR